MPSDGSEDESVPEASPRGTTTADDAVAQDLVFPDGGSPEVSAAIMLAYGSRGPHGHGIEDQGLESPDGG